MCACRCECVSGVGVSPNTIHNLSASISLYGYTLFECNADDTGAATSLSRTLIHRKIIYLEICFLFVVLCVVFIHIDDTAPLVRFTPVSLLSRPARLVAHRAAITTFFAWLHRNLSARNFILQIHRKRAHMALEARHIHSTDSRS